MSSADEIVRIAGTLLTSLYSSPFAFRELNADLAGTTVELTREQAAKFVTEVPPLPIAAEQAIEKARHTSSDSS